MVFFVHVHDAEVNAFLARHGDAADGQIGPALDVGADHAAVIHLVNVIAGQDEDVARIGSLDGVDVLIDGVGGALVPVFVDALLRRQHFDVFVQFARQEAPAGADVARQAAGLVLRQHEDAAKIAVDAIGEREIDDAIESAERHGRLGAIAGQGFQPRALAPGQNQGQHISHKRISSPPRKLTTESQNGERPASAGWWMAEPAG